jgi:hypothetical protein
MPILLDLPVEIIIEILSHVRLQDLDCVAATCKGLNIIVSDEELWKSFFKQQFHASKFSSLTGSYNYSEELYARNDVIRRWRKDTKITKIIKVPSAIRDARLSYPKCFALEEIGVLDVIGIEKSNIEAQMSISPRGCTSIAHTTTDAVIGLINGEISRLQIHPRHYFNSSKPFDKKHSGMVTAMQNDNQHCYSADDKGLVFISDLKSLIVEYEYHVNEAVMKLRGYKDKVVVLTATSIHIFGAKSSHQVIPHTEGLEFFEVDFGGQVIIIGNDRQIWSYSFADQSFGRSSTYKVSDEIVEMAFEHKSTYDHRIAGQDGCNMALITKTGRLLTFNVRRSLTNVQSLCIPNFDKKSSTAQPLCSIAVNSSVVIVGTYNGCVGVFDVLTGSFLCTVNKRMPTRHFPFFAHQPHASALPVSQLVLADKNGTHGLIVVDNVMIYFQVGEMVKKQDTKKKKYVNGVIGERKNMINKTIKTELDEIDYRLQKEDEEHELLERYNGADLTKDEEIELAMVLNNSLQYQSNEESEIAAALELSRLEMNQAPEHEISSDEPGRTNEGDDQEFERQLQEALRRSLLE